MANIAASPYVMKESIVTLGTDSYQAAVTSAALTPSASTISIKGLAPGASFTSVSTATWTLDLTYMQSDDDDSLDVYLFENEGDEVAFAVEPLAGGPTWSGTAILTPGSVGGAIDGFPTATVSLGIKGKPVRTPA